ncbi:hypothetical protein VOLCADRAFT_93264 [Volvox carteri f. nagariensis]|uniref:Uncharacterized protein n=1 Tax=Volvox carteri f. nagariensis TaxID=3068 RepID=D8U1P1_VOLCA|nr:uncharacterized protein VOLCADRAFT_93264 [Volvox carteri f. nagariensis]EFJ46375.1 hypothetical protein VOLCADRAFT_93264 [Volvox carteri f. nagariensis]|eukprot:XP_002952528.1 hypothetical protein VOLCADRAFT_93264 [Volvox carteri f. nagariensis]
MTEAPPLALARFLSEVWETLHAALRRFVLKRTREDDDGPPRNRTNTNLPSMCPPAFMDILAVVRNLYPVPYRGQLEATWTAAAAASGCSFTVSPVYKARPNYH